MSTVLIRSRYTFIFLQNRSANCKRVEQIAQKVVDEMGFQAEIIKVTDYADIMAYGIMSTPGLVVNEKVVSYGRIPSPVQILQWLNEALGKPSRMIPLA